MCIQYVNEMYLETLSHWNTYTPDIKPIPSSTLKEIITIILNQTFFEFNGTTYTQNYGITMGAPSSVKIANITLYKHLEKIQTLFLGNKPNHCFRLIDDIMGIWTGPLDQLITWYNYLNDSHPTIKFTIEHSEIEIPFLDTLTYVDNNIIKTKLYKKPTNKKQFLSFNSEHPAHMKKSIPYAQALRYRRIIQDETILDDDLVTLQNNFINRGYPQDTTIQQILKAKNLDRQSTITYKAKTNSEINFTPLVLTFSNIFNNNAKNNIYKSVGHIWNELALMAPELKIIKEPKIVFKRCSSISNSLESSQFPPKWWQINNVQTNDTNIPLRKTKQILPIANLNYHSRACNTQRCLTCTHIQYTTQFSSTTNNKTFKIKTNCNCNSSNLIYLITCSLCNIQYVGETGDTLRTRMNRHRSNIRLNQNTAIAIHFNLPNHTLKHLTVIPIELIFNDGKIQRLNREYYWQLRLGTIYPKGLNNYPVPNDNSTSQFNTTLDEENLNNLQALLDENNT
jgi:GIY-YIG catalytic domain